MQRPRANMSAGRGLKKYLTILYYVTIEFFVKTTSSLFLSVCEQQGRAASAGSARKQSLISFPKNKWGGGRKQKNKKQRDNPLRPSGSGVGSSGQPGPSLVTTGSSGRSVWNWNHIPVQNPSTQTARPRSANVRFTETTCRTRTASDGGLHKTYTTQNQGSRAHPGVFLRVPGRAKTSFTMSVRRPAV